jgi:hypothetical protein
VIKKVSYQKTFKSSTETVPPTTCGFSTGLRQDLGGLSCQRWFAFGKGHVKSLFLLPELDCTNQIHLGLLRPREKSLRKVDFARRRFLEGSPGQPEK